MTFDGTLPDWPSAFYLDFNDEERSWRAQGACAGLDPNIFFPPDPPKAPDYSVARATCAGCKVRDACLDHALWWPESQGFWGGMSERARRTLRRDILRQENGE